MRIAAAARFVFQMFVVIVLVTGCKKEEESSRPSIPVPAPVVVPETPKLAPVAPFEVAKLETQYGEAYKDDYLPVYTVRSDPFRVAVLATWCPFSIEFVERAARNAKLGSEYLLVVYEDEFIKKVRAELREGNITQAKADSLLNAPENKNRMLYDADAFLKHGLPFYVIRPDTLDGVAEGFPTRIRCSAGVCTKATVTLEEAKEVYREDPKEVAEIISKLPAELRSEAERNPEALLTALAQRLVDADAARNSKR